MTKRWFAVMPAIVAAATLGVSGQGQAPAGQPAAPPAPMAIKQVKPGLYMVTGFGGNSLVRVTDQGVILVDTKNLGDGPYNDLVAQIPMTRADVQAYQKKWAAIASKSLELRRKGVPKEQIRQQIQAELPEIAPWMMTGIVNDRRLDLFYAELTKAM